MDRRSFIKVVGAGTLAIFAKGSDAVAASNIPQELRDFFEGRVSGFATDYKGIHIIGAVEPLARVYDSYDFFTKFYIIQKRRAPATVRWGKEYPAYDYLDWTHGLSYYKVTSVSPELYNQLGHYLGSSFDLQTRKDTWEFMWNEDRTERWIRGEDVGLTGSGFQEDRETPHFGV